MQIGELERRSGLSRHTLRYYEREGLLRGVRRRANGYREYPPEAVEQLGLVRGMQALGFGLDEIRELLAAMDDQRINCADGARLLAEKRAELQARIRRLQSVSRRLHAEQKRLEARAARHGVRPTA